MIVCRKRTIVLIALCLILSIFALVTFGAGGREVKIIVDAGHGNPDGGAVGVTGVLEKDINLAIAMKLSEVLEGKGYTPIMTRTGDNGIYDSDSETIREMKKSDMNARLTIMKKSGADLFVSIHMNSFTQKSANGLHVFYAANHKEIKDLAEEIQNGIFKVTGAETHTVKTADERLFLMKSPPVPAILVECGFLSNPQEEQKLNTEDYQSRLAWAIGDAIDKYYQ